MRFLLVEDSEAHAQLARHTLRLYDQDAQVDHVESAEEALEVLSHLDYDLILLDYYLPGQSGLECLRTLRARNNSTPVIMTTSQGVIKNAVDCLQSGANDYVPKDEGYTDLLPRSIERVLSRFRAEREHAELQRQMMRKNEELEVFNRRLMQYQRQIIQAEKMSALVTLVRGICHELNNPLTGILGYSQLIQELYKDHECLEDVREIEICARRCREIIAKLASFCRSERLAVAQCDLNEIVRDSSTYVEYLSVRQRVEVKTELAEDLPVIEASPHDLRQVLLALYDNAVRAMPEGGTLGISTRRTEEGLELRVSDSGVGMPAELAEQIFTPFFTTRDVGEGTGLGLSMTLGIVQEHGGTIGVHTAPGQGTTFVLRFPLRAEATARP